MNYWYEVETKVHIKNVHSLLNKIRKFARLVKKEKLTDDYYALQQNDYPKKSFRIRSNGRVFIMNFKRRTSFGDKFIVVKEEHEFPVASEEIKHFLDVLSDFGFRKWIRKVKHIATYQHKKDKRITISVSRVEKLGNFMEIEYLAEKNEIHTARKKIQQVLNELNISKDDIENTGYTRRLYDLK